MGFKFIPAILPIISLSLIILSMILGLILGKKISGTYFVNPFL